MSIDGDSQSVAVADVPREGFRNHEAVAIVAAWEQFDLNKRKELLDSVCVEMREQKVLSMNGRKKLNELTRLFRSKPKEEQSLLFTELLKCYQEEIDQLSKRSKYSESSFYNLYKDLNDLPDPIDCIGGLLRSAETGSSSQLEIEKLRRELEHYDAEFRQLKNQDITIRRLEDRLLEYESMIETKVSEQLNVRVQEAEEKANERAVELAEKLRATEKRMQAAVEGMKAAQQSVDRAQTELFEITSLSEIRFGSVLNDQAILQERLDRSLLHSSQLKEEINALKVILNSTSGDALSGDTSSGSVTNSKLYEIDFNEVNRLQNIIESLRHDINSKESAFVNERSQISDQNACLISRINELNETTHSLEIELSKRPSGADYIQVIQKMKILQRIIFNSTESDDYGNESSGIADVETYRIYASKVDIDEATLHKLKGLEAELQSARLELREAEVSNTTAKDEIISLTTLLDGSRALVNRLEDNLQQMSISSSSSGSCVGKSKKSSSSDDATNELAELLGVGFSVNGTKKVAASSSSTSNINNSNNNSSSSASAGNSGSMVNILQAQRDRYKDRLTQVESLAVSLQNKLSIFEAERIKTRDENLYLYSKIRYFRDFTDVSSPNKTHDRGYHNDDGDDDIESKYRQIYEKKMNPFNEFSERERKRKFSELTVADKIVHNTALAVISTASGRSLLVLYLGSIHLLVFVILYYVSHHTGYVSCDPGLDHQHM